MSLIWQLEFYLLWLSYTGMSLASIFVDHSLLPPESGIKLSSQPAYLLLEVLANLAEQGRHKYIILHFPCCQVLDCFSNIVEKPRQRKREEIAINLIFSKAILKHGHKMRRCCFGNRENVLTCLCWKPL